MIFSIRDPRSHKKFAPSLFIGPSVSTATGTKMYFGTSSRYFSILRLAACSAAAPAVFDVPSRCEAAWVSGEVASQRRHFPACHGVKVTPSGRLASMRYNLTERFFISLFIYLFIYLFIHQTLILKKNYN